MTAHVPDRIGVRATEDHVEVVGLSKEDVEYAISLFQAIAKEQVHARSALASHVNEAMLNEGIELVPTASQRQVQRSAALKKHLLEDQGFETYASLAEIRETRESSVRTWVSRIRKRGDLFTVEFQGHTLIPRVQLTHIGDLNPPMAELIRPLTAAGLDGWSLWAWLTHPTGLLSGDVPAEVAAVNVGRARKAAERYAAELRQAQANVA